MFRSIDPMIIKKPWFWVCWALTLCLLCGLAFGDHNVATPYQLWNTRNDLADTFTQTANIDLAISNPATKPAAYAGGTTYQVGDSVTHTHGATEKTYFSLVADNLGSDPTDADTANWAIAWTTAEGWLPIGTDPAWFNGTFIGTGYSISNLYVNRPATTFVGLFGYSASTFTGVTLSNVSVTGGRNTGALTGAEGNISPVISGCSSTGTVTGVDRVGGLVGYTDCSLQNSYSSCTVIGSSTHVGGLLGWENRNSSTLTTCYATGAVTGTVYTGGLVGYSTGAITNCYAKTGAVSGTSNVGGLAGYSTAAITGCYSTRAVTGSAKEVGGLIGYSTSSVTQCYSSGTVTTADDDLGGLIGYLSATGSASRCYATGAVTMTGVAKYSCGGFVGAAIAGSTITNCYAKGAVSGIEYVGGFVGAGYGSITNCYATGAVTGTSTNGFCYTLSTTGTITLCYWDTTTSGQATSAGGTGFATASMIYDYGVGVDPPGNAAKPYYTWGLGSVWRNDYQTYFGVAVNGGYPILEWQYPQRVLIAP